MASPAYIAANPTDFGLTAAQATDFTTLYNTFTTAYATANDPLTRSPANILAKNEAKKLMVASIRSLVREIQGTPSVTNFQREELRITVRDVEPTPISPPDSAPELKIVSVVANVVKLRLSDAKTEGRGKPEGVSGASIFSYVGETAPLTMEGWTFRGSTTRTVVDVDFPGTIAPGSKVWFTAFWYNPRALSGPPTQPISTNLPGGLSMAA